MLPLYKISIKIYAISKKSISNSRSSRPFNLSRRVRWLNIRSRPKFKNETFSLIAKQMLTKKFHSISSYTVYRYIDMKSCTDNPSKSEIILSKHQRTNFRTNIKKESQIISPFCSQVVKGHIYYEKQNSIVFNK